MGDESENRCHGTCRDNWQKVNGNTQAWDVISRPQTSCNTAHHRQLLQPQPLQRNPAEQYEWIASHIDALKAKQNDLEPFTLIMDEQQRAAYKTIATNWERTHSGILNVASVPSFGVPASPVINDSGAVIAYCHHSMFTGVLSIWLFDIDGNVLFAQTIGELGLGDDIVGNELAAAIATVGISLAVSISRRIVSMAMSAGVRATARAGASQLLSGIAALAARLFAWRTVGAQALARLERTMENTLRHELNRSARVLAKPEVFRHTLRHEISVGIPYAQIERTGLMRLSKGGTAHYGEGVYAWKAGATGVGKFIDIEVEAGIAVEQLAVTNALTNKVQIFVRLLPATGDAVAVRLVGTNLTEQEIAFGRALIK